MIWFLRFCFGKFCALGWDFHHRGWENQIFVKILYGIVFLLMICFGCWPLVAKRTCIKSGFHDVHSLFYIVVHSVQARCLIKCLLDIFLLVWTPTSTKLWGFSFGSLVVYLTYFAPHVYFPCFGHALHITTFCTHLCCPCHALVYTLLLHPSMSCLPYAL